jgi:hypothetical protein
VLVVVRHPKSGHSGAVSGERCEGDLYFPIDAVARSRHHALIGRGRLPTPLSFFEPCSPRRFERLHAESDVASEQDRHGQLREYCGAHLSGKQGRH